MCVLYRPLPLELTVVGESVVMENEEVFEKNGFKFVINEEGEFIYYIRYSSQNVLLFTLYVYY